MKWLGFSLILGERPKCLVWPKSFMVYLWKLILYQASPLVWVLTTLAFFQFLKYARFIVWVSKFRLTPHSSVKQHFLRRDFLTPQSKLCSFVWTVKTVLFLWKNKNGQHTTHSPLHRTQTPREQFAYLCSTLNMSLSNHRLSTNIFQVKEHTFSSS